MQISAVNSALFKILKGSRLFKGWVEFLGLLTGHSLLTLIISTRPLYCVNATLHSAMTNHSISDVYLRGGFPSIINVSGGFHLLNTERQEEKLRSQLFPSNFFSIPPTPATKSLYTVGDLGLTLICTTLRKSFLCLECESSGMALSWAAMVFSTSVASLLEELWSPSSWNLKYLLPSPNHNRI